MNPSRLLRFPSLVFALALGLSSSIYAESKIDELRAREKKVQSLVERVMPAIVCITTKSANGTGSGVIINKEGLILTAGHVTQATGKELDIIFPDGKHVKGTALGANYGSDAGLAKIDVPGDWPYVEMGDSNKLNLGDWCVAMGHPGGFNIDRKPPVRIGRVWRRDFEGGIFTDCTLIGGDSGGPLFDLEGKVIGIHSSINASAEHNRHIAVDTFVGDWDDLKSGKSWGDLRMGGSDPKRPKLGLSFDTDLHEGGARVSSVASGTPNEKLGIKEGDAITKFDGAAINNYWALMRELSDREIGAKVKIEVKRGDEILPFEIELLTRESKSKQAALAEHPKEKKKNKDADPILPDEPKGPRPYFGATLDGEAASARIGAVSENSPAAKAGLKVDDIISSIDGKEVKDSGSLAEKIKSHKPGDKITLSVKRGSDVLNIELTLDKK